MKDTSFHHVSGLMATINENEVNVSTLGRNVICVTAQIRLSIFIRVLHLVDGCAQRIPHFSLIRRCFDIALARAMFFSLLPLQPPSIFSIFARLLRKHRRMGITRRVVTCEREEWNISLIFLCLRANVLCKTRYTHHSVREVNISPICAAFIEIHKRRLILITDFTTNLESIFPNESKTFQRLKIVKYLNERINLGCNPARRVGNI